MNTPDPKLKLPWTVREYGHDKGHRFTVIEIFADIHVCYNGSGGEPKMLQTPEEVQSITKHIIMACNNFHEMKMALEEAQKAFESNIKLMIAQCELLKCDPKATQLHKIFSDFATENLCAEQIVHLTLKKLEKS